MSDDIAFASATELARKIKSREVSSEALLTLYLDRVDRHNGALNAIIWQMRDEALARARAADAALANGDDWGPLHGVPMTVKESFNVEGTPSTWGDPNFADSRAPADALAVTRLKRAGAVIFGKTNVPLGLADMQSYNEVYGQTNNPWDLDKTPGGSSGGSAAALAAGLTGLECGSDIGGSIRNPAFFCGVFGHKPTWNLLPPRGHAKPGVLAPPDISVIGPLARSAADLETAVRVMAGPDEIHARGYTLALPTLTKPLSELKVAVWRDDAEMPVAAEVAERVDRVAAALESAGAAIDTEARPDFASAHTNDVYNALLDATMTARLPAPVYDAIEARADALDRNDMSAAAEAIRHRVPRFRSWFQRNEQRMHIRWAWHSFFEQFDVLLAPIMPVAAFSHDHRPFGERSIDVDGVRVDYGKQVFWAGLTGNAYLPATVIPTGPNAEGLPIGVQIAGPEFGDLITIGVASELETLGFSFQPAPGYE